MGDEGTLGIIRVVLVWIVLLGVLYVAGMLYFDNQKADCIAYCDARFSEASYREPITGLKRRSTTLEECTCI